MVYLSNIYTKSGDDGTTGLGDGSRRPKDHLRVESYGTVDELNAVIGLLIASNDDLPERDFLVHISNDLFDVGADLCVPIAEPETEGKSLRVVQSQVDKIEQAIDRLNENLPPLKSFILPGGTKAAAWCHVARTICRRAERRVVSLSKNEPLNPLILIYLNRLSDLLFVLGRVYNNGGKDDVLWKPGAGR
ncbi:cob(I)yrinic acid a,c-diamide adenosyltransferase [bacterium]|nr:cob(I)yrinic acid a,c-diamide adenosyltransferase [bacterium]